MNKKLTTLAGTAMVIAPLTTIADTTLYGRIDISPNTKANIYNMGDVNPQYSDTSHIGNTLSYESPKWSGFSGALLLSVDEQSEQSNRGGFNNNKGVDQWNLSLNYDNGPLSLGFDFLEEKKYGTGTTDVSGKYQMTGIGGSYIFNQRFKLIGQYESGMSPGDNLGNTLDISEWTIAGEYKWANNIFRGSYADYGKDLDGSNIWALGWQYNFSKRNRVYAKYFNGESISHTDVDRTPSGDFQIPALDGNSFGFGIRHDF